MKVVIELDLSLQEIANAIGVKSKSYVHKMLKNGNGERLGELLVNDWRTIGERLQNVRVLKTSILDTSKVNDERTIGERLGEREVNAKENEQEKLSPHTPYIKEKEKEKDLFPDIHLIAEYQCSLQENVKQSQCFTKTEEKKEKKKTSTFCPPTIAEVQRFVDDKGYHVDAEHFCAFYESNGWMVGKNHMKSWRMAVVTWEKTEKQRKRTYGQKNGIDPYSKRRGTEVIATSAKDYEGRF